jgi:hypothetical protein
LNRRQGESPIPAKIRAAIKRDFEDPDPILRLVSKFLIHSRYNRQFFQFLLRTARGEADQSWSVRRLALALMERQLSALSPSALSEFDKAIVSLGLKKPGDKSVAAELVGRAAKMPLAEFVLQLLRKMNRRRSAGGRKTRFAVELADLLHRSTQECKLVMAPCVFSPKEIFERILLQVKVSEGVLSSPFVPVTKRFAGMRHLSACEREILRQLQSRNQIYWVGDSTSSRINSLVEYPLRTAVLVLKLPGSHLEIELKRAGKRERPLQVLYEENGAAVPIAHRLQGGSTGWMLKSESENESRFCSLFRAIHQQEPPLGRTRFITNIRGVPCKSGTADLLTWFTGAQTFGSGYREMRLAIKRCLESFGSPVPEGCVAQTVAFLQHSQPRQSVLVGTSSFRLDRLSEYLSPLGAKRYFGDGLGVKWTPTEARQFADDLLEEVLGTYVQPNVLYRSHQQYLEAAFAMSENRAAANANYLFCMEQIGLVWGTMMAIGSHSTGESFVPRNVGLKAVWQDGSWRVKIILMDHDCLESPKPSQREYHAEDVMAATIHDETHIFGHALPHRTNIGAVTCLQDIYRIPGSLARKAIRQLQGAMLRSFCKARVCSANGLLPSAYFTHLLDFEEVVRMSINPDPTVDWIAQALSALVAKGYTWKQSREYQETAKKHARFFREHAFLYQLPTGPQPAQLP